MNDIIKDFNSENFTKWEIAKYGVLYPIGLIAACMLAEWIVR